MATVTETPMDKLTQLGAEMSRQDNHCTAHPLYVVQEKQRHYGFDPDYAALIERLTDAVARLPERHELGDVRDAIAAALAAQAPPASDQPGPTVINEDDGDVTIDFDYANDRVVSIRLGEESSGLSAFVDGESHALCPLDRVPPKVLALLRTEAKAVTLRQSDPPGLVDVVRAWQEARTARMELFKKWECDEYRPAPFDEVSSISFRMDEATKALDAYPLPASPQAKED